MVEKQEVQAAQILSKNWKDGGMCMHFLLANLYFILNYAWVLLKACDFLDKYT
jgi:hypothetical protein